MKKRKSLGRPSEGVPLGDRVATTVICLLAGFMITVGAIAARGEDLRPDRAADLKQLVADQAQRNVELNETAEALREEVEGLRASNAETRDFEPILADAGLEASTIPLAGPAVRVTLTDAPLDVNPDGVNANALVVHQQDIQAVINALWTGGAEGMSLQGQRIIGTTGIKCVGNSVVLHGVPYAPPYVIEAVGPQDEMLQALANSELVGIYRQYADAYGLGYQEEIVDEVELPAFAGALGVTYAEPIK